MVVLFNYVNVICIYISSPPCLDISTYALDVFNIQLQVFLLLNNQTNRPAQTRVTFNCAKIRCINISLHQIWKSLYMYFRHPFYDYDRVFLLK